VGRLRRRRCRRRPPRLRARAVDRHRLWHRKQLPCLLAAHRAAPARRRGARQPSRRACSRSADPASADGARILRVPATLSHKHDPPTAVEALRLDTHRRLSAADVVGDLDDPPAAARATVAPAEHRGDDPLLAIPPDVYVPRLLGVEVPRHHKVRCPFHDDRHASLHVYDTAARGWYCFGACRRGGTIYDLAAPLYGYDARGEDFLRLRGELRRLFGLDGM